MTAPQLLAYIRAALLFQLVVGIAVEVWRRRGDAASMPLAAAGVAPTIASAPGRAGGSSGHQPVSSSSTLMPASPPSSSAAPTTCTLTTCAGARMTRPHSPSAPEPVRRLWKSRCRSAPMAGSPASTPRTVQDRSRNRFCLRHGVGISPTTDSKMGRWIPFAGQVAWVIDREETRYWRGTLTDWSAR